MSCWLCYFTFRTASTSLAHAEVHCSIAFMHNHLHKKDKKNNSQIFFFFTTIYIKMTGKQFSTTFPFIVVLSVKNSIECCCGVGMQRNVDL